jgi:hypothetical protein
MRRADLGRETAHLVKRSEIGEINIGRRATCRGRNFIPRRFETGSITAMQQNGRPFSRQLHGRAASDPVGGAGDQDGLFIHRNSRPGCFDSRTYIVFTRW